MIRNGTRIIQTNSQNNDFSKNFSVNWFPDTFTRLKKKILSEILCAKTFRL